MLVSKQIYSELKMCFFCSLSAIYVYVHVCMYSSKYIHNPNNCHRLLTPWRVGISTTTIYFTWCRLARYGVRKKKLQAPSVLFCYRKRWSPIGTLSVIQWWSACQEKDTFKRGHSRCCYPRCYTYTHSCLACHPSS